MDNARSYFDPISNRFVIPDIEVEQHFFDFIHQQFPIKYLPAFLHEASHHFCISSPVGLAFSLLNLENRVKTLDALKAGEDGRNSIDMIYRYRFTLNLLRPILEGIALFVEHDARAGVAKSISKELAFVKFIFGVKDARESYEKGGMKGVDDFTNKTLDTVRLTEQHIDKKLSLLLGKIDPQDGGHLLGYLTIKNLFLFCHSTDPCDLLADSDLFVQVFGSYIFQDWRLVELILDDSLTLNKSLTEIIHHIDSLLKKFLTLDYKTVFQEYEERAVKNLADKFDIEVNEIIFRVLTNIIPDELSANNGKALLASCLKRVMTNKQIKKNPFANLESIHHAIIINNSIMSVGCASFRAIIRDDGWVELVNKQGRIDYQIKIENKLPKNWDGWIHVDLLSIPSQFSFFVAFVANKKIINIVMMSGGLGDDQFKTLKEYYVHRSDYHKYMNDYNNAVDRVIGELDIAISHDYIKGLYHHLLTLPIDPEKAPKLLNIMENDFSSLIGSFQECRQVAEISLKITTLEDKPLPNAFIDSIISHNIRMKTKLGYSPFVVTPNGRIFSLI